MVHLKNPKKNPKQSCWEKGRGSRAKDKSVSLTSSDNAPGTWEILSAFSHNHL